MLNVTDMIFNVQVHYRIINHKMLSILHPFFVGSVWRERVTNAKTYLRIQRSIEITVLQYDYDKLLIFSYAQHQE